MTAKWRTVLTVPKEERKKFEFGATTSGLPAGLYGLRRNDGGPRGAITTCAQSGWSGQPCGTARASCRSRPRRLQPSGPVYDRE